VVEAGQSRPLPETRMPVSTGTSKNGNGKERFPEETTFDRLLHWLPDDVSRSDEGEAPATPVGTTHSAAIHSYGKTFVSNHSGLRLRPLAQ
jgi:hypothetical protein